jgi:hypothetical protein
VNAAVSPAPTPFAELPVEDAFRHQLPEIPRKPAIQRRQQIVEGESSSG